jgi:hypothetical protein
LDIEAFTGNGERVVAEIKTTTPHRSNRSSPRSSVKSLHGRHGRGRGQATSATGLAGAGITSCRSSMSK